MKEEEKMQEDPDTNHDKHEEEHDILSYLNYKKLEQISEDFKLNEGKGLGLTQYIKVMLKHLPDTNDRVGLVKSLIELFK